MEIKGRNPFKNLTFIATIITVLVIVAGFAMISPIFRIKSEAQTRQKVMLSFSISQGDEAIEWCKGLATLLNENDIGATVFITGKVAEQYPGFISYFSQKVDIGSQTYSNLDLTTIADYSIKLKEVEEGKKAVDKAGNLYSRVFRAPFGAADQDIYSLLSRSGIMADFSYGDQYNIYQNGQFIKYEAIVCKEYDHISDLSLAPSVTNLPIIIFLDDTDSIASIKTLISRLKMNNFELVNASDIVGFTLTDRLDRR